MSNRGDVQQVVRDQLRLAITDDRLKIEGSTGDAQTETDVRVVARRIIDALEEYFEAAFRTDSSCAGSGWVTWKEWWLG
jgi:hypothetical protein